MAQPSGAFNVPTPAPLPLLGDLDDTWYIPLYDVHGNKGLQICQCVDLGVFNGANRPGNATSRDIWNKLINFDALMASHVRDQLPNHLRLANNVNLDELVLNNFDEAEAVAARAYLGSHDSDFTREGWVYGPYLTVRDILSNMIALQFNHFQRYMADVPPASWGEGSSDTTLWSTWRTEASVMCIWYTGIRRTKPNKRGYVYFYPDAEIRVGQPRPGLANA